MGMRPIEIVIGQRFERWTVLSVAFTGRGQFATCRCDCGEMRPVAASSLGDGTSTSCGCRKREILAALSHARHGHAWEKTTRRPSPTYRSWVSMNDRCQSHEQYVARGISVCLRWRSFEAFLADMGERPAGTTLDRIDNEGNYRPGNCRWATPTEQGRNRRSCLRVLFRGRERTIAEIAELTGLPRPMLYDRIDRGWPHADIATPRLRDNRRKTP